MNTVLTEPVGMQAIDSRQSPRYKAAVMFWFSMFIGSTINPLPLLLGPKPPLLLFARNRIASRCGICFAIHNACSVSNATKVISASRVDTL